MAKKQKNIKHKEAMNRKREAISLMSEIGLLLTDKIQSIAIIFEHIGLSQIGFCALRNISEATKKYPGLDINIFVQRDVPTPTPIRCPIFSVRDIISWEKPIISTSISTTMDAINSQSDEIYHYVFDIDFINREDLQTQTINDTFNNPKVTLLTRTFMYKKIIEQEFGVTVSENIIPDFDIIKMAKIIFGGKKNGSTIKNE